MLKNILELNGAQELNKSKQKNINGGANGFVNNTSTCAGGSRPLWGLCVLGVQTGYCTGDNITRPC